MLQFRINSHLDILFWTRFLTFNLRRRDYHFFSGLWRYCIILALVVLTLELKKRVFVTYFGICRSKDLDKLILGSGIGDGGDGKFTFIKN